MRNRDLRRFYLGAVILFAASCAQIVGMEEGVLRQDGPIIECKVFEDCLASGTECRVPETCTDGKCQFKNTIRDKLVMNQTAGDCKKTVCDGQGSTEDVVDDTDVHDDENDCTADSCNGGDAVHMPIPDKMLDCYTGPEGTEGVGICAPGKRACDAQGQPGKTCDGQVLPQSEVCDISPLDEDCNGMTNETGAEGGTCSCGDNVISAAIGEICDDGNVIGGDECSPICSPVKLVQLASGCHTTCAVFSDDTVKCWGYNMNGQLGIGSTMNIGSASGQMGAKLAVTPFPSGKKVLKIAGQLTFCALLDDHALRCWGLNDFGQLGEGNTNNRGDNPMEMGDMLPAVDLGPGEMVTDFAVGGHHVCAIVTGGAVKCWGAGIVGQLGMENNNNRGGNMGQMGANVPMTPLGTGVTVKQIAAGDAHNCVITADDRVKC